MPLTFNKTDSEEYQRQIDHIQTYLSSLQAVLTAMDHLPKNQINQHNNMVAELMQELRSVKQSKNQLSHKLCIDVFTKRSDNFVEMPMTMDTTVNVSSENIQSCKNIIRTFQSKGLHLVCNLVPLDSSKNSINSKNNTATVLTFAFSRYILTCPQSVGRRSETILEFINALNQRSVINELLSDHKTLSENNYPITMHQLNIGTIELRKKTLLIKYLLVFLDQILKY